MPFFGLILLFCAFALAAPISTEALSNGGNIARDKQLREISEVLRPNVLGYIDFGVYYFPYPRQTPLRSDFGKHDGYAFNSRVSTYFAAPLANSGFSLGFLWWIERQGFDEEDFLLFPKYGEFSLVRNVQTAGVSLISNKHKFGLSGGIQYANPEFVSKKVYRPETDSLYGYGHAFYGPFGLSGSFGEDGWNMLRSSLRLESKELYGGASGGVLTYLPNIEATFYRDASDSVRVSWEQNLYKQKLYAEIVMFLPDYGFFSGTLKYYPDPSRLVSFDLSCFKDGDDFYFGGGMHFLMFRVAYNHATDYENLFRAKNVFVLEVTFSMGSTRNNFFGRNAPKAAPMEEDVKTIHENGSTYKAPEGSATEQKPVKEITAKGIRVENAR